MNHQEFTKLVDKHAEKILEVERYVWQHPESGYREWNTTKYLARIFEEAGYQLTYAGDIPGFYTDIDTGKPGPKILILGEMDALLCPNHPEQTNGCAHACGHNTQCASLVGIALALKEPGALNGLCGSIRLCAVPAEELIEIEYRDSLRKAGTIHYLGGKTEYLYRGYFDGCDIAFMNHATTRETESFLVEDCNGCLAKTVTYTGVASHAGGSPDKGVNAMYAATQGLTAINALRETFRDDEHVRVHPIITSGGSSVNIIPSKAVIQSFVRGATVESMKENNRKVNRALASGALALGAKALVEDRPGYFPLQSDKGLRKVLCEAAEELIPKENVFERRPWSCGSTDMGDLSAVMRAAHCYVCGAAGHGHGDDYFIKDPYMACVKSAMLYMIFVRVLLENEAGKAREVLAGPALLYPSKEEYFKDIDTFMADRELVSYTDTGAVIDF